MLGAYLTEMVVHFGLKTVAVTCDAYTLCRLLWAILPMSVTCAAYSHTPDVVLRCALYHREVTEEAHARIGYPKLHMLGNCNFEQLKGVCASQTETRAKLAKTLCIFSSLVKFCIGKTRLLDKLCTCFTQKSPRYAVTVIKDEHTGTGRKLAQ